MPTLGSTRWGHVTLVSGIAVGVGILILIAAGVWSAADYNTYEDLHGEGATRPVPVAIPVTGGIGASLAVVGAVLFVVAAARARVARRPSR